MSVSQTKNRIISKREGNQFLHAAALLPVQEREMDLSTDHPNFLPDESILDGAIKALEAGETHYVDVPGVPSLRDSIVTYLQESGFANYNQDTVQVTAGMQECRFLSIQNIGDQQPSIAIPTVVHPGVHKAIGIRPMKVVSLPVDSRRLLPTIEGIQHAIAEGCRMIYLESPSRLTGGVYSLVEVQQIGELVKANSVDLLWDQGLSPWMNEGDCPSVAATPGIQDYVTILGELWPGTGMERFYLGYIAGPEKWMKVFKTQKQVISICTNAQIQFAAIEAFPNFKANHESRHSLLAENHRKALFALNKLNVDVLQGSTVNLIAFRAAKEVLAKLSGLGYKVVDGGDFGAEGVLRISITPQGAELEALKRL